MPVPSRTLGLALAAALGAGAGVAAGQAVMARRAFACECSSPRWQVQLHQVSSTSPDVSADHQKFWPATATLTSYKGWQRVIQIWSTARGPGQITTAEATQ